MRILKALLALLAVIALVAGCGDDDSNGEQAEPSPADVTDQIEDDTTGEPSDDEVAAVVDGDEIRATSIEKHVDAFAESPQFSEQLDGPAGEQARGQLRAQVLSSVIQTKILSSAAEELDRPVSDDDLAEARAQVEAQAGGPEALQATMDEQGLTEAFLDMELEKMAALSNVEAALNEQGGEDGTDDSAPAETAPGGQELSPSELRVQAFLGERLAAADVSVESSFGEWDAQAGQVIPAGGAAGSSQGGS